MAEAIILKNSSPVSHKIVIFDKDLGKIDVMLRGASHKKFLVRAGLIEYEAVPWRNMYMLQEFQLIEVPVPMNNDDILCIHHWLELADLFCSYAQANHIAYSLLKRIYSLNQIPTQLARKRVIASFLAALGIYPEHKKYYENDFFNLILTPLDTMLVTGDAKDVQRYIDEWLIDCLSSHPEKPLIKTMAFLKR